MNTQYTDNPGTAVSAIREGHKVFALFHTDIDGIYHEKECSSDYIETLAFEEDESSEYEESLGFQRYSGFLTFKIN